MSCRIGTWKLATLLLELDLGTDKTRQNWIFSRRIGRLLFSAFTRAGALFGAEIGQSAGSKTDPEPQDCRHTFATIATLERAGTASTDCARKPGSPPIARYRVQFRRAIGADPCGSVARNKLS
jgi:hypothetical protein